MSALGKPIALGRTAEIHAWGDGQILKLFYDRFALENIEFEQRMNRAAHASGLPVPAVGEIVQVDGRYGLVYERIDGVSMLSILPKKPWLLLHFARHSAELHAEMHANTARPEIPAQRRRLVNKIDHAEALPAGLKEAALSALAALPDGEAICHGDFHPDNILFAPGRVVTIDWIDASLGNPLADVARTTIILLGAAAAQVPNRLLAVFMRLFHAVYLHHYFRLQPGGEAEHRRWLPIVAAARLSENIAEMEGWLVAQARRGLEGASFS
jgi:Ser/Thr protein kinase RdoA (MazF antagonist)